MTAPIAEGDILAEKYRVDQVLGAGGMGVVVAAHHIDLDEKVAIKFLLPETLGNQEAVARFAREARSAVKIKSEHVAKVTDVGKLPNGAPYMVMEYLEGSDLSKWLQQNGALPVDQAVDFVLQACEAIAEAHTLGIVHRDLKPANLFVIRRPDGGLSVKVLDFGISKTTGLSASGSSMTRTSAVMGSPLYMSPEQMQSSRDADARSDIWSLGVILYELLTADLPFVADTMPELVARILSAPPIALRNKRPDVPDGLEAAILKCLDKDRGRRLQTVGELAAALAPFAPKRARVSIERIAGIMKAAGFSATALAAPPSSDPVAPSVGAGTEASWGRTASTSGRSKTFLGILAAISLAGAGAFLLLRGGSAEKADEPHAVESAPAQAATTPVAELSAAAPSVPASVAPAGALAPAAGPEEKPSEEAKEPATEPAPAVERARPVRRSGTSKPVVASRPAGTAAPTAAAPPPAPTSAATSAPTAAPKKPNINSLIDDRR